jgi:hypothetical protein
MRSHLVVDVTLTVVALALAACSSSPGNHASSGASSGSGAGGSSTTTASSASSTSSGTSGGPCTGESTPCGTNGVCCKGTCLPNDANNCGGCGVACAPPGTCVVGSGGFANCAIVVSDCSHVPRPVGVNGILGNDEVWCSLGGGKYGICCGPSCKSIDTSQDSNNCGGCGRACPSGTACMSSLCTNGGQIGGCGNPGQTCPMGYVCDAMICVTSTCSDATASYACLTPSSTTGVCCGSSCVDVSSDPMNCGGCSTPCAAGKTCQLGACH